MKPCRPDCQCPNCDPEMAAIMRMTPEQHSGWLRLNAAKVQQQRVLRTAVPSNHDTEIPDGYAQGIAAMRAARATPQSIFEERYKADRLRELEEEYADAERRPAPQPAPRLTAAELAAAEPPNGYQIALDKMRSESR
jgi:hypothetical protein